MKLVIINGVPNWEENDVRLPVMMGSDHLSPEEIQGIISGGSALGGNVVGGGLGGIIPQTDSSNTITVDGITYDLSKPEQLALLISGQLGGDSSGGQLGFGQTESGFKFQRDSDIAAATVARKHDKKLLGLRAELDKLQKQRDNAFAKGERIAGQKFQIKFLKKQQQFQKAEARKDRDFQRELKKEELKAERQRIFVDMMGKDPVRATLFALGVGGSILPGGERFEDLPALKGAGKQAAKTKSALGGLLGKQVAHGFVEGQPREDAIGINRFGVTGLPPAIKSARAFQDAGAAGKTTLTSAFGVGDIREGRQPGINPQEFLELIDSVTPKGTLQG